MKPTIAQSRGSFWLVCGRCDRAVRACNFPAAVLSLVGGALAFGLILLTMAGTIGPVSVVACQVSSTDYQE